MNWRIDISQSAEKFLIRNKISFSDVEKIIGKTIHYLSGGDENVDIRKLKGTWKGFYRIRRGKMRIIAEFHFGDSVVFIEEIDWRGSVYK